MFRVGEEERNSAPSVTTGALWGDSKLAKMAYPGSLASRFVNNDYVTAEIIYSTAPMRHEVLTWSRATLGCMDISAHLESGGIYCCITVENIACLVLQLLHQPGVNNVMATVPARREFVLCYGMAAATATASARRD